MSERAMDRLKKARAKMLVMHPFFATLMMSMPMIETKEIPTAATDMKSLYINPDFIDTIDDNVLMFVIAHEIMHTALEHGLRRQHRPPLRWNVACDYSINLTLKDCGLKVWEHALCDEKYRNDDKLPMSADAIDRLLEQEEREQQKQQGQGQPGQGQPGGEGGQQQGAGGPPDPNAPPQPEQGQGQPQGPPKTGEEGNAHHSPMLGDLKEPEETGDPVAQDRLARDIQQRVAQAATIARMTGNMPGALEKFVNQVLDPKVPWYDTLRHFMTEVVETDEDWCRRNRRFPTIYLPSDHADDAMGEFIAIGDASGSCYDDMERYFAEFLAVAEDCKPEKIRLIWADTRVTNEQEFEPGDEIKIAPKGFGGTDMRVPLKHVEQYDPKIVVLFTDGYTPWPDEEPPYPLLVCCTTGSRVPVGEVIRI